MEPFADLCRELASGGLGPPNTDKTKQTQTFQFKLWTEKLPPTYPKIDPKTESAMNKNKVPKTTEFRTRKLVLRPHFDPQNGPEKQQTNKPTSEPKFIGKGTTRIRQEAA